MQTTAFIDKLTKRTAATQDRIEALSIANSVQNYILGGECPLQRVQPDPLLHTVDSQYSYVASTSIFDDDGVLIGDIRSVRRVYALDTRVAARDVNWPLLEYGYKPKFGDRGIALDVPIGAPPSRNALSADCKIKWPRPQNPKDTTTLWRVECFTWPQQLTSENIPLSIPDEDVLPLLMRGCLEYIEEQEYGAGGWPSQAFKEALADFNERWASVVVQPAEQTENVTPYRPC